MNRYDSEHECVTVNEDPEKKDSNWAVENLADLCHEQWAGWLKYMFSKCAFQEDGTVLIPKDLVNRWGRQMYSDYSELTVKEKESDRVEARKFLAKFHEISDKVEE